MAAVAGESAKLNRLPYFLRLKCDSNGRKITLMVFKTGNLIITGIPNIEHVDESVCSALSILKAVTNKCYGQSFTGHTQYIKTIMATSKMENVRFCPYYLKNKSPFNTTWEPEICNSINLRRLGVTAKLFPSTLSLVLFGKNFDDMEIFFSDIIKFLHINLPIR
jgi:TATA-box binding protein (TBP) (component of TFIID and TFIIIB)